MKNVKNIFKNYFVKRRRSIYNIFPFLKPNLPHVFPFSKISSFLSFVRLSPFALSTFIVLPSCIRSFTVHRSSFTVHRSKLAIIFSVQKRVNTFTSVRKRVNTLTDKPPFVSKSFVKGNNFSFFLCD